ncbi:MAG TPA: DMT family transporter [Caulobacterales bacterium]|nr:DMT family transporter [Caulobacterales bacterium]
MRFKAFCGVMMVRDEGRGVLAVAVGAALLGLSPLAVRLSEVDAQATNFWRFAFALPILGALALGSSRPSRGETGLLLLAGLMFGLELGLWAAALSFTTVVNATLLSNLTPLVAAAFAWFILRERIKGAAVLGAAVAMGGAVALTMARVGGSVGGGPDGPQRLIGDALGFSSAFGYAGYLLIVRALGGRVRTGAIMFWATLSAAAFAFCATLAVGQGFFPHSAKGWAILVGNGVLVQAAAQGMIAYGVARLPIAISTVLLWLQPLSAAALSWMMFGEALTPLAFVGCALILGGVWIVQRTRNAPPSTPQAEAP